MIDVSHLPTPDALAIKSYEDIVAENIALLQQYMPDYDWLESDDYMLLVEAFAYRELHLRQAFNNRLKASLLLTAKGSDLDARALDYGVTRLEDETDTALLQRTLDSLDRFSTAGSAGSYQYHAKSASSLVHDAKAVSPQDGKVTVYIANFDNALDDDAVATEVIALVNTALSQPKIQPLCFEHTVVKATIKNEQLSIAVELFDLGDQATVEPLIRANFARNFNIHEALTVFEIVNNCNVAGVKNATPTSHNHGITPNVGQRLVINDLQLTFSQDASAGGS